MAGTTKRLAGPLALTTTYTTNIYVPASALVYSLIRQLHIANKGGATTFRLYLGATGANAAGTELFYDYPVPANSTVVFYWPAGLKVTSADFLVGGCADATRLSITITGDEHAA